GRQGPSRRSANRGGSGRGRGPGQGRSPGRGRGRGPGRGAGGASTVLGGDAVVHGLAPGGGRGVTGVVGEQGPLAAADRPEVPSGVALLVRIEEVQQWIGGCMVA